MEPVILAKAIRGETVESLHRGHVIALEGDGTVVLTLGDPSTVTFFRSAAKPLQAIPFIASGACDAFGHSDEEIALACASHSGETRHVRTAALMLERAGLTEAHLRCGTHLPFNEKEATRMQKDGEAPTQLHNNCSGKHGAMLATAKHSDFDITEYNSAESPLQRTILETVSIFTGIPVDDVRIGIDGCAVPNFAVPVKSMALSFARMIAVPPEFPAEMARACERIVAAMVGFPELIGGTDRLDTLIMEACKGRIISKVGADGVWLAGVLPCERWRTGLAIAMKIEDGDDRRARPVAAVELLRSFGVLDHGELSDLSPMLLKNRRDDVVGRVEAELEERKK